MIADTALLLGLALRQQWNVIRRWGLLRKVLMGLLLVVGVGTFGTISGGAGFLMGGSFHRIRDNGAPIGAVLEAAIPGMVFTGLFALLLLSSFGVALGSLFLSNDLERLMSAPVDRRAVVAAKLVEGLGYSYGMILVGIMPGLITYGLALQYSLFYYPLGLTLVFGAPPLAMAVAATLVMLVARYSPAARVREVLGFATAIFGMSCSFFGQTARFWMPSSRGSGNPSALVESLQQLAEWPIPTFMAARALVAVGHGGLGPAFLYGPLSFLLTFGIFVGTILLTDRLYATGWVRMQGGGVAKRRRRTGQRSLLQRAPGILAVALKDWRILPRDLRNFARVLAGVIFLPILYFNLIFGGGSGRAESVGSMVGQVGGGMNALIAAGLCFSVLTICLAPAQTSISMEGKAWWLMKTAPIHPLTLLGGKFIVVYLPYALLSLLVFGTVAVLRGMTLSGTLYGLLGMLLIGAGSLALEIGLSVPWAKLDWEDPRQMSSGWGGLIAFIAIVLYGLLAGVFLASPLLLAFFDVGIPPASGWLIGPIGATILTVLVMGIAGVIGTAAIPEVGEK